jgi:hypothetical protein
MAGFTRFTASVATLAIASIVAGCSGGNLAAGAPNAQGMKCLPGNGGSARPCAVRLAASETSATVKTRGPKGGSFSVRDNHCATKDIVTLAGSGDSWTITAGTNKGHCTVNFIDSDFNGKKLGVARVDLANVTS